MKGIHLVFIQTIGSFGFTLLMGCDEGGSQFSSQTAKQSTVSQMSPKERQDYVANDLFAAVLDRAPEDVSPLVQKYPDLMNGEDINGDRPLMIAIRRGYQDIALRLIESLSSVQDMRYQNHAGEGYVFWAAATGQNKIIEALANRYYNALGEGERYYFSRIDQEDKFGRRALFVAANRAVALELEKEYFRGFAKIPYGDFWLQTDKNSQTFLHRAAEDGRFDVINWASERICAPSSWENSEHTILGFRWLSNLSYAKNLAIRGFQTRIGDFGISFIPIDLLFNRRDDSGNGPLHIALQNRQREASKALMSCRWLDYDLTNAKGEIPLQAFLKMLNTRRVDISLEDRNLFDLLLEQQTIARPLTFTKDRVNWPDSDGNTSLHLAALLADEYFYIKLSRIGNVYAKNNRGQTPRVLRGLRDKLIRENKQ